MQNKTALTVSPHVASELWDMLPASMPHRIRRQHVEEYIQEIILQAQDFILRFQRLPDFLASETWHEFIGLVFHDPRTKRVSERLSFALSWAPPELSIVSLKEIPEDEMSLVRQVIAESHLPEYNDDRIPSSFFQR